MLQADRARIAGLLALLGVLLALILAAHPAPLPIRRMQELGVHVLLLLACLSYSPLRAVLLRQSKLRLVLLGTFLGLAVLGQLFKDPGRTFPFVVWGMYASATPSPRFVRQVAVLRSGRTIDFPFDRLNPSRSVRAFATALGDQAIAIGRLDADDPRTRIAAERLGLDYAALVAIHNRRHPADPIEGARASLCTVPIESFRGPASVSCRRVASYVFRPR